MKIGYIVTAIVLAAAITFALRALPFLIFHGERKMQEFLVKLGAVLPAAIMAVLIVYCLKDIPTDIYAIGIPKIVGVLTTGISYLWKHNTFVSIILGTVIYMVFIQFI